MVMFFPKYVVAFRGAGALAGAVLGAWGVFFLPNIVIDKLLFARVY
jgi:hypothetical protein